VVRGVCGGLNPLYKLILLYALLRMSVPGLEFGTRLLWSLRWPLRASMNNDQT
jgi:hypothetical protein